MAPGKRAEQNAENICSALTDISHGVENRQLFKSWLILLIKLLRQIRELGLFERGSMGTYPPSGQRSQAHARGPGAGLKYVVIVRLTDEARGARAPGAARTASGNEKASGVGSQAGGSRNGK
jgi:hypothetical protein